MAYDSGKTGAEVVSAVNKANGEARIDYVAGTDQVFYRLNGADVSTNATNFNFAVATFNGVNEPGSSRENNVVSIGWNVQANGAREDVTQANLRIAFEEHYLQGGTGTPAYEFHVGSMDESGVEHRPISMYLPKDGGAGSTIAIGSEIVRFRDYAGTVYAQMNASTKAFDFSDADFAIRFPASNKTVLQQRNAANSSYLFLPYYDSDDRIRCQASTVFIGATPTTGSIPNRFAYFQATSLPANGTMLDVVIPSVTGNAYYTIGQGSASGVLIHRLSNTHASGSCRHEINVAGTGDPLVQYQLAGTATWTTGIDNSASDVFTISNGSAPGTNDRLRISTAGDVSIPTVGTGLRVAEGSNAKQGVATLVDGTVTVANTSVTVNSRIMLTSQSDGGTPGFLRVSARTAGTSFTITSSSATDTSVVAYQIFEPA